MQPDDNYDEDDGQDLFSRFEPDEYGNLPESRVYFQVIIHLEADSPRIAPEAADGLEDTLPMMVEGLGSPCQLLGAAVLTDHAHIVLRSSLELSVQDVVNYLHEHCTAYLRRAHGLAAVAFHHSFVCWTEDDTSLPGALADLAKQRALHQQESFEHERRRIIAELNFFEAMLEDRQEED